MRSITKEELISRLNAPKYKIGVKKGSMITTDECSQEILLYKIEGFYCGEAFELEERERMLGFDYEIPNKEKRKTLVIRTRL